MYFMVLRYDLYYLSIILILFLFIPFWEMNSKRFDEVHAQVMAKKKPFTPTPIVLEGLQPKNNIEVVGQHSSFRQHHLSLVQLKTIVSKK